jgi:GDP-4-dehydro-6-deoxy-D-mannose reductase
VHTVFVTGAGGFTGARLVEHLRQRGYDVVAGVRNRARKLAYERANGRALVCDVADAINVARAIASVRPDGVIHLAGMSTADATARPLEGYQTIVASCANLLDAVRRAVPRAKVVLASACDVYGNGGRSGQPLSETAPLEPVSTFGSLKVAAESVAHTFHRDYHVDVTIVRPFHYTGPGQSERCFFGAVALKLATWDAAIHGQELALPDLAFQRDVLHIGDVVTAYERVLLEGRPDETYNLCSGNAFPVRELVEIMAQATTAGIRLVDAPAAADPAGIPIFRGDNTKICRDLHWTPAHNARDAVRELVASFRTPAPALAS